MYKAQLQAIDPTIEYLMTLYLSPDLTPDEIRKAKRAGIVGQSFAIGTMSSTRFSSRRRGQIVPSWCYHKF